MIDLKSKLKTFAGAVTRAVPQINLAVEVHPEAYTRMRDAYMHPPDVPAGAKAYTAVFNAAKRLGVNVEYVDGRDWPEGAMGNTNALDGIKLRWTGNQTAEAATLAHELSHWVAHVNRLDRVRPGITAEIQAEGAAVLVMAALGVEKPESAFYLANHDIYGDQVLDNAEVIENTAKVILAAAA